MRRLSVSNLVSPGPRVPMPPPRRESASPFPFKRGYMYCSWASSTCNFPSPLLALRAKISRMSVVRSITFLWSSAAEMFSVWEGESSPLNRTVTSSPSNRSRNSCNLPGPITVVGFTSRIFWKMVPA